MENTRETDYNSVFATNLRDRLAKMSISKTKLAKDLGVKQQTVSQWADGSTTPKLEHLKLLASYFGVSIDELATGVAPSNKEMHSNTGLTNLALEKLKSIRNNSTDDNNIKNEIVVEFLSLIIESIDSRIYSLSRLAELCMNYIVGAHEHILWQEDMARKEKKGYEFFSNIDRPNLKNDNLDFRTYQLTKDFEYFIQNLAKNQKIWGRARKIYQKGNLDLPNFSDYRFDAGIFDDENNRNNVPDKINVHREENNENDDTTNAPLDKKERF